MAMQHAVQTLTPLLEKTLRHGARHFPSSLPGKSLPAF